jgi:glycosyltransferase involved in cell wall biosynthesis
MKILFVRTYCPNKLSYGAELRALQFVDYFKQKGQMDLLTLTKPGEESDAVYIKKNFRNFYYFDQRGEHPRLNTLEKLITLLPWQINGFYAKDFQQRLNKIVEENQYDLIFVFKLEPVYFFLQLASKWHSRVVMDFDDILSDLYSKYYKNPITSYKNSRSLKLYEKKALQRFNRVFVCSQDAVAKTHPHYRHKVGIIPNIIQSSPENFLPVPHDRNRLLFVGSLDYLPNIDGLKWFFQNVWPEFKALFPQVKLTIIGKSPQDGKYVSSFLGDPRDVEIVINVPSVEPYYRNCFATIVPLIVGSGTRLKILESVSYHRPVLTTLKGLEGLAFRNNKEIMIFKDPRSFKKAYEALLDPDRYQKMTKNALQVLEQEYSQNTFDNCMRFNIELLERT